MVTVHVNAEWRSGHNFEFEDEREAVAFARLVNRGGEEGLDAIIEAGDVTSQNAELINWSAADPRGD